MFWSYAFLFNPYRTFRQASDMRCLLYVMVHCLIFLPHFSYILCTYYLHFVYILILDMNMELSIVLPLSRLEGDWPDKVRGKTSPAESFEPWL